MLCSPSDLPPGGFINQVPLVARGNCTFYEKVRLAQGGGARGLLVVSKEKLVRAAGSGVGCGALWEGLVCDRALRGTLGDPRLRPGTHPGSGPDATWAQWSAGSRVDSPHCLLPGQVPPGGNRTQYEEIGIPVALLSHRDMLDMFQVGAPGRRAGVRPRLRAVQRAGRRSAACPCPSLQNFGHQLRVALYAPSEPVLDYNMVIIFIMAVGTVALGGYWAGSRDVRR